MAGGGIGTIEIALIALYFGIDPSVIINQNVQQGGEMVSTDSFTHGNSAQRVRWFLRGIEKGDINQSNTFSAERL